jgi:SAM-dependent methyltransferase
MVRVEDVVIRHYGSGRVMEGLADAFRRVGMDERPLTPADLRPVDEFHVGGGAATEALLEQLTVTAGTRVLDMGSGIGGPARLIAERYGARVIGVDLTPEYVRTAEELSARVGLGALTSFRVGSVTALPVEDASVDLALMLHVGMNVADKPAVFREAVRVLRPGGVFALYEVTRGGNAAAPTYPLPWAEAAESSFVVPAADYVDAAEAAGLDLRSRRDRTAFGVAFFGNLLARIAREGPPAIGLHLLMGPNGREKIGNLAACIGDGRLAPMEMIFERPASPDGERTGDG